MELAEIIGEGQFGDVHKGVCRVRDNSVPVAVKTCKADADMATAEKFLEEACMLTLKNLIIYINLKIQYLCYHILIPVKPINILLSTSYSCLSGN